MAPTTKFLLPDDDSEYSSENQDLYSLSPNSVPRSLLTEDPNKIENFPPFIEPMPEPTNVIKGFGLGPVEPAKEYDPKGILRPAYPPPSNQAYWLTSDGHDPKFAYDRSRVIRTFPSHRSLDGLTFPLPPVESRVLEVAKETSQRRDSATDRRRESLSTSRTPTPARARAGTGMNMDTATSPTLTEGEKLAAAIDWNRSGWRAPVPGAADFYPAEEQRADFIKVIDDYAKTSLQGFRRDAPHLLIPPPINSENPPKILLEYCKKCGKDHIPPGSPISLPDRDTCGAYLPDWFPSHNYKKPWENFRQLYNKIIMCEEMERGFKHSGVQGPTQQVWDKEYHDEHPKWRVIGRRHGWWKCRTGPHASEPEITCELCHKPKPAEDPVIAEGGNAGSVSDQRMYLEKWVEERMNAVGVQDKAIGVELIHRMKPQEVLGYFTNYKVPAHELEGYDTGNDSDPDGEKEMSAQPKLKPMVPVGGSTSTLDLGGKGEKWEKIEKDALALSRTPTASSSSSDGLCMRPGKSPFRK